MTRIFVLISSRTARIMSDSLEFRSSPIQKVTGSEWAVLVAADQVVSQILCRAYRFIGRRICLYWQLRANTEQRMLLCVQQQSGPFE